MVSPAVPIRRADILRLAQSIRQSLDPHDLDAAARKHEILLVRTQGPMLREAGFAYIENVRRPRLIESLAKPEVLLPVWGEEVGELLRSIVIKVNSGVPEHEVFWHEYFHLFYSPYTVQRSHRFEHHFSMDGALHSQEERRADEFAAAVLIPTLGACGSTQEIMEQFEVSERLAIRAVQFYASIRDAA